MFYKISKLISEECFKYLVDGVGSVLERLLKSWDDELVVGFVVFVVYFLEFGKGNGDF